jgi:hypothetical protein
MVKMREDVILRWLYDAQQHGDASQHGAVIKWRKQGQTKWHETTPSAPSSPRCGVLRRREHRNCPSPEASRFADY